MTLRSFYGMLTTPLLALLVACGGSNSVTPPPPPPPVVNGTLFFALDNSRCPSYTTAEYVADSVSVGIEPIAQLSKGYTVASGKHVARARLTKPGTSAGLWTFNDPETVPQNGSVTAHITC